MNKKSKIVIRYFSQTGNTQKLAEEIAKITGTAAETVSVGIEEKVDILFLGSSVYGGGVSEEVKSFIANLDSEKVKRVACFSTAALLPSTYKQVSKLLAEKKIAVDKNEFHCRGRFKFMHKTRPDDNDIKALGTFVKTVCEQF